MQHGIEEKAVEAVLALASMRPVISDGCNKYIWRADLKHDALASMRPVISDGCNSSSVLNALARRNAARCEC